MTVVRQVAALAEIEYPESDGRPLAESDWHRDAILELIFALSQRYRDDPSVYVSGDLFVYYEEGNPRAVICPDVFVVFGVPKRTRRTYKLWEEGRAPTVVFEVSSRSTQREDFGDKQSVYAMLGVEEYFIYDPEFDYLDPVLRGFRLGGGAYRRIRPEPSGGVRSVRLGLTFLARPGEGLRVIDSLTGDHLLGPVDTAAARQAAEVRLEAERKARLEAEVALEAERQARLDAEASRDRERNARLEAEAEAERLRAEIARFRP